jgi:predicted short-subunit dehydrogenase-like oxidoreductase (DUF2520 family)
MRELERTITPPSPLVPRSTGVGVVGRGRVGTAISAALRDAGYEVATPLGRDEAPPDTEVVLLCVPDSEIASAAAAVAGSARFVGHTSGATPLTAREGAEAFGLHPLQTITGSETSFQGCGCAIAGSTPQALDVARRLALDLGMRPFEVRDEQRAAYHAAASIASNFLVTLEADAERVAKSAGIDGFDARTMLGPLVRTTVENWIETGPERALTGPIARGDHATVAAQRRAIQDRCPELEPMFDALVERTEALAGRSAA